MIQSILNRLHEGEFKERIIDTQEEMQELNECDGYKDYFNMKAVQVNDFQNLVKLSMVTKLSTADEMALYKAHFDQFISECNDQIVRFYGFGRINEYV